MLRGIGSYIRKHHLALIALFVALTGTAYAATKIGARDIKRNAIRSKHIKDRQVRTRDLARSIPAVRVTSTTEPSIPETGTDIAFDSERFDTAGMHSNTTNNTRIKAPVTGIYNITLQVQWFGDPDGYRYIDVRRNGTTEIAEDQSNLPPFSFQSITTQARLQKGDFIVAFATQNSGGPLDIVKTTNHEYSPELSMTWLAPG